MKILFIFNDTFPHLHTNFSELISLVFESYPPKKPVFYHFKPANAEKYDFSRVIQKNLSTRKETFAWTTYFFPHFRWISGFFTRMYNFIILFFDKKIPFPVAFDRNGKRQVVHKKESYPQFPQILHNTIKTGQGTAVSHR